MNAPWRNEKIRIVYERPEIRASVEIILSVFTVTFLLTLAIRPTLATVATLQKKIADQVVVDTKLSTKIGQLAKASADLGTYADRISDFSAAVADVPDESGVAKRFSLVANENNVAIQSLALDAIPLIGQKIKLTDKEKGGVIPPLEKDGKVASFSINFDVSGEPTKVIDFLSKIENMDRVVLITAIDLKKEEVKASGTLIDPVNNLRAIGRATAYYVLLPSQTQ